MKGKVISMLTALALALSMAAASAPAFADKDHQAVPRGVLASQIEYRYVGDEGTTDTEGRLLVWEATITGDFTGEMKWWFEEPPVADSYFDAGFVAFYAARWEIWSAGKRMLLLAGESAGKTVFPFSEIPPFFAGDGIWDGHGVVTEAKGKFNQLKGRKMHETGTVIWRMDPDSDPLDPLFSGRGMFLIY